MMMVMMLPTNMPPQLAPQVKLHVAHIALVRRRQVSTSVLHCIEVNLQLKPYFLCQHFQLSLFIEKYISPENQVFNQQRMSHQKTLSVSSPSSLWYELFVDHRCHIFSASPEVIFVLAVRLDICQKIYTTGF